MTCTGACCESFTLVENGERLTHAQHAAKRSDPDWFRQAVEDNDLARLAIPTTEEYRFDCTRFDRTTRLCSDYEHRPQTCRDFPVGAMKDGAMLLCCHHCGATS